MLQHISDFSNRIDWDKKYTIYAKKGANFGFLLSHLSIKGKRLLVVCEKDSEALSVYDELRFFGLEATLFPSLEIIPYSKMPPQAENLGKRICALFSLTNGEEGVYITSLQAIVEPVLPKEVLKESYIYLLGGEEVSLSGLIQSLLESGYERVFTERRGY